jgi:hypothetical protein
MHARTANLLSRLANRNDAELAVSTRYVGHIIDHTEPPLLHALLNSIFPVPFVPHHRQGSPQAFLFTRSRARACVCVRVSCRVCGRA